MTGLVETYVLPVATSSLLGGVKPDGTTITNTAGAISVTSPATATGTAVTGQIPGTATNDDAAAGNIGEFVSSNIVAGSAVGLSNNIANNITSLSLTAGDWDVWGLMHSSDGAGTVLGFAEVSFNTAASTEPASSASNPGVTLYQATQATAANFDIVAPAARFSLSAPATIYFVVRAQFTVGTMSAYGWMGARRVR